MLKKIGGGIRNAAISRPLGISGQAVKDSITTLLRKLGGDNPTQDVALALHRDWLSIDDSLPVQRSRLLAVSPLPGRPISLPAAAQRTMFKAGISMRPAPGLVHPKGYSGAPWAVPGWPLVVGRTWLATAATRRPPRSR